MYQIRITSSYKKSLRKIAKSGAVKVAEIDAVIDLLIQGKALPGKYRDHKLTGELKEYRECHIRPDLLLIYKIEEQELILILVDIGSHAELFG